ncbi:MAG: DUF2520 domain-containing protein [Bacteroidales bacterium]|jgi:predicted short-subunit dehydrogenase-like oxidoreductase (DUF2520 family)|nr:DUF2520 domain-containing protein [Bacteroidales bacterium]
MFHQITLIGTGNIGSWFCYALTDNGFHISQIYSRRMEHAQILAAQAGAEAINQLSELKDDSQIYIFALPDDHYQEVLAQIPFKMPVAIHTSGSLSQKIFKEYAVHYGVVYPFQTISKGLDFNKLEVPLLVEGDDQITEIKLLQWAQQLSHSASFQSEAQRFYLHLSAVFASNFSNAMFHIAYKKLQEHHIDWNIMMPLLRQTVEKITLVPPIEAQTGPASRGDVHIMKKHQAALSDDLEKEIYRLMSKYIETEIKQ